MTRQAQKSDITFRMQSVDKKSLCNQFWRNIFGRICFVKRRFFTSREFFSAAILFLFSWSRFLRISPLNKVSLKIYESPVHLVGVESGQDVQDSADAFVHFDGSVLPAHVGLDPPWVDRNGRDSKWCLKVSTKLDIFLIRNEPDSVFISAKTSLTSRNLRRFGEVRLSHSVELYFPDSTPKINFISIRVRWPSTIFWSTGFQGCFSLHLVPEDRGNYGKNCSTKNSSNHSTMAPPKLCLLQGGRMQQIG